MFLPQVAASLIYTQTFAENIQNAQAKYLSIDILMRLQQTLMTVITQTTVMMSGAK